MSGHPVPEGIEAAPPILEKFRQIGPSYRWWAAGISMVGSFTTLLMATVINVAIPDIMGALGMTLDEAQWLASAFLAAGTITMLITAWCMASFGIAASYIGAMLIFTLGSIMGAAASSSEWLLIARVVQGAGAGLATPISMVVTAQVFPVHQRGMAMGLMGIASVLAPAIGPSLGGFLVDHLSWRWVFIAAVPLVVASIPAAWLFLPGRDPDLRRPAFDWMGAVLCSTFIVALLVGLAEGQRHGWYHDPAVIALATGTVAGVLWVLWELYVPNPMLDVRLFANPRFAAAGIVMFTLGLGIYGSTYLFPLFLQNISRLLATDSGLLMAPGGFMMAALFPLAGTLADRTSHRTLIVIGLVLFALSNAPMTHADAYTPMLHMLWWYVLGRIGLALSFPSLNAAALNALALAQIPQGSGAINFLRQLGGAFGVSLISLSLHDRMVLHYDAINASQSWDNDTTMELLRLVMQQFQQLGMNGYYSFEVAFAYVQSITGFQSNAWAYRDGFYIVGALVLFSIVPALFIQRGRPAYSRPAGR